MSSAIDQMVFQSNNVFSPSSPPPLVLLPLHHLPLTHSSSPLIFSSLPPHLLCSSAPSPFSPFPSSPPHPPSSSSLLLANQPLTLVMLRCRLHVIFLLPPRSTHVLRARAPLSAPSTPCVSPLVWDDVIGSGDNRAHPLPRPFVSVSSDTRAPWFGVTRART